MTGTNDPAALPVPPLTFSRRLAAPRPRVFRAWSTAEHMKRWFSPAGYTTPDARIDFRSGGACDICMRGADGIDHWSRGHYVEIVPPERLVFVTGLEVDGIPKMTATTTVTFDEDGDATRLTVHQAYVLHDAALRGAIDGAPEGWRTTLDKLDRELERMHDVVTHAAFVIERSFAAPPSRVFHAFTDPEAKSRWFTGGDGFTALERVMDVRPGGHERLKGQWASGTVTLFDVHYFDVVPDRRLVYAYEMHHDARKLSVSLATLELHPEGSGTRLVVTEQGAFLDGYEDAGSRERGTGVLLDRLAASLQRQGMSGTT